MRVEGRQRWASGQTIDVLIGGYLSTDAAMEDYRAVLDCGATLEGAVVVSKDLEGTVSVEQTDHMVRKGRGRARRRRASWSDCSRRRCSRPPRSARPSGGGGRRCTRRAGSKIEEQAGETIPLGGAGLIVAYQREHAEVVEPAVTRAITKVVGEADGRHVAALKGALADAQQQMADGRLAEGDESDTGGADRATGESPSSGDARHAGKT